MVTIRFFAVKALNGLEKCAALRRISDIRRK